MHIENHPFFENKQKDAVTIYFNNQPIRAFKQQTVAAALIANGVKKFGVSRKLIQPRGLFCSRGRCCSCYVTVNGEDHVRSCMKRVEDGMSIYPNQEDPELRREIHGD